MFRTTVIISIFLLLQVSLIAQGALPRSCDDLVKSYTEYTQKEKGLIVKKHTISQLDDWARDSRFQGLLLTDKAPSNAEIVLEARQSVKGKIMTVRSDAATTFSGDKRYRAVAIDIEKYLGEAPKSEGYYIIRIFAAGKELCSTRKRIYNDGD